MKGSASENIEFSKEVIDYILDNELMDPYTLMLKKSPFPEVEMKVIAQQIQGRKIAKSKFPFLLNVHQYRFPKKESLEQASSETSAIFKSKHISGKTFVDLTGGMGIDTYLLGRNFEACTYIEPNQDLFNSTTQNFKHLGFDQCISCNSTCEEFLQSNNNQFDWAYIDPSRRIDGKRKTSISNYTPNLVELQHEITRIADNILVKLSPMQDISECVNTLKNVHHIWVVSIQNEVKELLLHIKRGNSSSPNTTAVDINQNETTEFSYLFEKRTCQVKLNTLEKYLYQPGSAIIKAELQNRYALSLGLEKLHKNTQLFTADHELEHFSGRTFLVKEKVNLNKKEIKKVLPQMQANVITKNFPLSPQELIRKFKLKEGGSEYLIAFTNMENKKVVALCERIT